MAANLKKAGNAIRKSFRTSKYSVFGMKDDSNESVPSLTSTPKYSESRRRSVVNTPLNLEDDDEIEVQITRRGSKTNRRTAVTNSMREAVVNIRQKLRVSTRRRISLKENTTPIKKTTRRQSFGGVKKVKNDVQLYSPFCIDTPTRNRNRIKTCVNMETPTRLRREVEALTANMQALSALTPNTLQTKSIQTRSTRKSPPLTNGSLKTPRSTRKHIITEL